MSDALIAVATLAGFPAVFNGTLTGAVDVNAAFTLGSGYLVRPAPAAPPPVPSDDGPWRGYQRSTGLSTDTTADMLSTSLHTNSSLHLQYAAMRLEK